MLRHILVLGAWPMLLASAAEGAPRLSVVAATADSADTAISVRLDTDGLNVVGFRVVFNNLSTCIDPVAFVPGADVYPAGLDVDNSGWGTGSAGTEQPIPPPFDQFLYAAIFAPQQPIVGLNGSNLEIARFEFLCAAAPATCPLRWEPAPYSPGGQLQLSLADGSVVGPDGIELVPPPEVFCETTVPVERTRWGHVKILYSESGPQPRQ